MHVLEYALGWEESRNVNYKEKNGSILSSAVFIAHGVFAVVWIEFVYERGTSEGCARISVGALT